MTSLIQSQLILLMIIKSIYIIHLPWKEKSDILRKKEPPDISRITFHGYIFQNQDKINDSER